MVVPLIKDGELYDHFVQREGMKRTAFESHQAATIARLSDADDNGRLPIPQEECSHQLYGGVMNIT